MRNNDPMAPNHDARTDERTAAARAIGYSEMRARILAIAFRDGFCTAAGLMREIGISRSNVNAHIRPLVEARILDPHPDPDFQHGPKGGTPPLRWYINASAFDAALDEYRNRIRGTR